MVGSACPASIAAIHRAKLEAAKNGDCLGPMGLNERVSMTAWLSSLTNLTPSCSCASLLTAYGLAGPIGASSVKASLDCR